ncbi:MAG: CPBP family intramembrane metalloprotease [Flavobacteriales bacterium]|nr:CPBP family intramembrane metalloprotease [Flavobacteriales bacterium]
MNRTAQALSTPLLRLLFFIVAFVVMTGISAGLATLVSEWILGTPGPDVMNMNLESLTPVDIKSLRLSQSINQLFGFLGAAVLYVLLFGSESVNGFMLRPSRWILLAPLVLLVSMPLLELTITWNEQMIPENSWLAEQLKPLQELTDNLTLIMMRGEGKGLLISNLVLFALIPAVCEEVAFRGIIQSQSVKLFGNIHVGIWVSAAIFSAIHMQFYGFIPRMLLGAVFGYLVVYSGSLWSAIVAHFLNNALAVFAVYMNQSLEPLEGGLEEHVATWPYALLSLAMVVVLLSWMRRAGPWSAIRQMVLTDTKPHHI